MAPVGDGSWRCIAACRSRPRGRARHHRSDLQLDRATGLPQPAGRAIGLLLGIWLRGHRANGFAPANIPTRRCPTMQVPGPTLIVTEGQTVTVTLTNNLPTAAGNTSILFPGFNVTATGGVAGLLTQEAAPGGDGDLHVHCLHAGNARLLQRHAGRPAGRDGPVRRDHRAPGHRPRRLHVRPVSREPRWWSRHMASSISGWRRPPTTTPRAATTGNTCSSSPRWIPISTARPRRRSLQRLQPVRPGRSADAASMCRPSPTTPRIS